MIALGQTFIQASIHTGPRALPQCFRQLCIIKNLWQPGEPCKLFKTLNIYGLKWHRSGQPAQLIVNILQQRSFIIRKPGWLPIRDS